jgi:hypothetical protein
VYPLRTSPYQRRLQYGCSTFVGLMCDDQGLSATGTFRYDLTLGIANTGVAQENEIFLLSDPIYEDHAALEHAVLSQALRDYITGNGVTGVSSHPQPSRVTRREC